MLSLPAPAAQRLLLLQNKQLPGCVWGLALLAEAHCWPENPGKGGDLVLAAAKKPRVVRGLVPKAGGILPHPNFEDLPPHLPLPSLLSHKALWGSDQKSPSTCPAFRATVAKESSGGGCNMTTFILLSNLNWIKMFSGGCHCTEHNSKPWRLFCIYLYPCMSPAVAS